MSIARVLRNAVATVVSCCLNQALFEVSIVWIEVVFVPMCDSFFLDLACCRSMALAVACAPLNDLTASMTSLSKDGTTLRNSSVGWG